MSVAREQDNVAGDFSRTAGVPPANVPEARAQLALVPLLVSALVAPCRRDARGPVRPSH